MSLDVRERLKAASHSRKHADKVFVPGSWVYVWRRPSPGSGEGSRARWTGPGATVFQQGTT
eukprot:7299556-Pyramimonas_sp.AAC.1